MSTADYITVQLVCSFTCGFSVSLCFPLCLSFPAAASPEAETAAFDDDEHEEQNYSTEEDQDVQAVILVPGELVGLYP